MHRNEGNSPFFAKIANVQKINAHSIEKKWPILGISQILSQPLLVGNAFRQAHVRIHNLH